MGKEKENLERFKEVTKEETRRMCQKYLEDYGRCVFLEEKPKPKAPIIEWVKQEGGKK